MGTLEGVHMTCQSLRRAALGEHVYTQIMLVNFADVDKSRSLRTLLPCP